MKRLCAFLTMANPEGFFVYDHLAHEPLKQLGWDVIDVVWSAPSRPWSDFDAVVIRSPWDYQQAPEQFLATLQDIQAATRLLNPIEICRWNMNKKYLKDLHEKGVPIVPTTWLDGLSRDRLSDAFNSVGEKIVVKPTVGANADNAFVLSATDPDGWTTALEFYAARPLMLQPFVKSISTIGEYSLFYFGSQFSHAILKQPKAGDFRVQEEHGGVIRSIDVDHHLRGAGDLALDSIGQDLLYARVDLVFLEDGTSALMELELIEPSLYFSFDKQSPILFANALDRLAKK